MLYPLIRSALVQFDPEKIQEQTIQALKKVSGTPFEALITQRFKGRSANFF